MNRVTATVGREQSLFSMAEFASHAIYYVIAYLAFANLAFFAGFEIQAWYLPVTYISYVAIVFFHEIKKSEKIRWFNIIALVFFLPLIFTIAVTLIGHTFDGSYDGQGYHQSAIIALVNNWNPWRDTTIPLITSNQSLPFVLGYPKAVWIIQASIYKLFPQHINGATATNLFFTLIAFIFVYRLLSRFNFSNIWAAIITSFAVLQPGIIQQFVTFMEDGLSYEVMLIAISALVSFIIGREKRWPLAVFLSSEILLLGAKYSNLIIVFILGVVCAVYLFKIMHDFPTLKKTLILFLIAGVIILWAPYGNNLIRHHSPVWPSNQKWAMDNILYENTPLNLKDANKITRLFYGIYSQAQTPTSADNKANVAILKIPFTTTSKEIAITNNYQGRVGSEGVFFSGLFTLSVILYGLLFWQIKTPNDWKLFAVTTCVLLISIGTALMNPVPNKLRYTPIIYLIPIYMLAVYSLMSAFEKKVWMQTSTILFALLIGINMLLKLVPTVHARLDDAKIAKDEMNAMKNSGIEYQVQSKYFYSSYIRLQEYNIIFTKSEKLSCKNPHSLKLSNYTTFYCP
jgi:hypothetical protein